MRKILLFVSIAAFFAACTPQPKFELEVNIQDNSSLINKKIIVSQQIDGVTVYTDTSKIKKDHFVMEIPYKGQALLNLSIPTSNVNDILMASEEGKIQLDINGTKPHLGGTPINDRLQAFYLGGDSVSSLFKQLATEENAFDQQSMAAPANAKMKAELQKKGEELRQKRQQLLKENTDRIVAFIKENVDNPIGEYFFMTHYITFPVDRKLELNAFATDKLKKAIGIQ